MTKLKIATSLLICLLCGCVYFNTFFLAKQNFKEAEQLREKSGQEIARGGAVGKYQKTIEKASIILEFHPDSKYVDDALYLIGRSFYHTGEFKKAETKFRELLATHPETKYSEKATFYLGKSRFWQEDYIGAREVFEQLDTSATDKNIRSESMFMLGDILFVQEEYERAIPVFREYLEGHSGDDLAAQTQFRIASSFFIAEQYDSARTEFMRVIDLKAEDSLKFRSRFNAGDCFYQVEQYDSGLTIFRELADDEKNFDQLPHIYLQIADGERLSGGFDLSIETYRKLIEEYPRLEQTAIAFYHLGTIYQEQFLDLESAKAMYDSSTTIKRKSSVSSNAVARSADIANLDSYRAGKSAEAVEEAIESQYLLAELFLTQLHKPDSAVFEYQALLDSFPESRYAPQALIALGWIHDNVYVDSAEALAKYESFLERYPNSDFIPQVLERLSIPLDSTTYDFPARRYAKAEKLLIEDREYRAAKEIFESIVTDFPESEYAAKADWALAWSLSRYENITDPDSGDSGELIVDSTFILAYQRIVDTYEDSKYADAATNLLQGQGAVKKEMEQEQEEPEEDGRFTEAEFDSIAYLDSINQAIEEEIAELYPAPNRPTATGEFIYPISAYDDLWEGEIKYKVLIDFTGKVTDWEVLRGSGIKDMDFAASETLKETYFNPADIDPINYGKWLLYRYIIRLPEELQGSRSRE